MSAEEKPVSIPNFPLQAALFEASLAVMAIVLGWVSSQSPSEKIKVSFSAIALGVLAVLPLLAILLACQRIEWRPVKELRRVLDEVVVPLFRTCNWIEIAAISFLAGLGEELLFRGLLQNGFAQWTGEFLPHTPSAALAGDWMAVIFVAILFGALHAVNLSYAVLAAIMGAYLGWLYLATGNLTVPIIAHGLYDFIALAYVLKRIPQAAS
jgi:membrane protease YdiL (CAAX protease family)